MTTYDPTTYETVWQDEEWYFEDEYWEPEVVDPMPTPMPLPMELYLFVGVGLLLMIGVVVALSRPSPTAAPFVPTNSQALPQETDASSISAEVAVPLDVSFTTIYDDYVITQGPHGTSYGHYAIDIAAGAGAEIYSPIHGTVSAVYTDEWGNPTLVIENKVYSVTMLHGNYTVSLGQEVAQGDIVGTESNQGNTYDMAGNSCRNRNCGYHTHLNVFDKRLNSNVNPLDLLNNG